MTQALMRILALFFTLFATSVYAAENNHDYPLGPGDVLRIQVFRILTSPRKRRVSGDRRNNLSPDGNVEVGGLVSPLRKKDCGRA